MNPPKKVKFVEEQGRRFGPCRRRPDPGSSSDAMSPDAGIYVHVPFCRQRCHFCSFAITTHRDFEDGWFDGVLEETALRAPAWTGRDFDSVYFGGGTPSLVAADRLAAILARLRETFRIADDSEITVEVNPGDLSPADLDVLRAAGVNRLSVGVQSFDDGDLEFLTRHHSGAEGRDAIRFARAAGFECLTIDLLYGIPGRRVDGWKR
ncbi:MAG: radical SAM protein [Planctomycetota bacterium]